MYVFKHYTPLHLHATRRVQRYLHALPVRASRPLLCETHPALANCVIITSVLFSHQDMKTPLYTTS